MQRLVSLFVALLLGVLPAACSGTTDESVTPTDPSQTTTVDPEPEPKPACNAEPDDEARSLFDSDEVHTFELTLAPEDIAFLDEDPVAEVYVPATLEFGDEKYLDVGVRYKGSIGSYYGCTENPGFPPSGAKTCIKLSLKVKMNLIHDGLDFHGMKKLQFHALNTDESLMRERLSYYLFRAMGIAAPRTTPVRLLINGELAGFFLLVEQIDGRFARARFGDGGKGNVYKEIWPQYTNTSVYRSALETNEEDGEVDKMVRLAAALSEAAPEERAALSDSWMERDYIMNYMAVDRTIKNDDGAMHWYCNFPGIGANCNPHNFYWYEEEESDKLWLVPWDTDLALRSFHVTHLPVPWNDPNPSCIPEAGPLGSYVAASCDPLIQAWSTFETDYASALEALLAGPYSFTNVTDLLGAWESQIASVVEEAYATDDEHLSPQQWRQSIENLKRVIQDRREFAQDIVAASTSGTD